MGVTLSYLLWAVPMSKQVNRVNIEPEMKFCMETGLPTGSIVTLFTSCKTVTIHYNAGHTYTMQELVKEVTLINHSNNGIAILHGIKLSP